MVYFGLSEEFRHEHGLVATEETIRVSFYSYFDVDKKPEKMPLKITALSIYKLWINGKSVIFGPCRGRNSHFVFYDTVDIAEYVHEGKNTITVQVISYPYASKNSENNMPHSRLPSRNGPLVAAECDGIEFTWFARVDNSVENEYDVIRGLLDCSEHAYGSKALPIEPDTLDGYEKAFCYGKGQFNEYGEAHYRLIPCEEERPVPLMYREEKSFKNAEKVTVKPHSNAKIVLEADRVSTAFFRLRTVGGSDAKIKITYAECLYLKDENGELYKGVRDVPGGIVYGHTDVYYPSGKDEVYEPFLMRTFRFVKIDAETGDEELVFEPVDFIETGYPLEIRAEIESDMPWVKDVWDISVNTLQNCMHDTYEDCPYYEQLQYTMDTYLETLYTYASSGDSRLAKRAIEDMYSSITYTGLLCSRFPSKSIQIIPGFSLYWILMLKGYYMQTGDVKFLKHYLPRVMTILNVYVDKIGDLGMVGKIGFWEFADWNDDRVDLRGVPEALKYGPSALHNLHFVYVARTASFMFREAGWNDLADEYENIAKGVADAVELHCYNPERKMYREGKDFEQYSRHTQVWAVLSDTCTGEKASAAMQAAMSDSDVINCSFVMQYYLFRALEKTGMYEKTYPLWDMWKGLLDLHLTTIPETPSKPRSDCHAWGALALHEFPAVILGVRPTAPGWKEIAVKPRTDFADRMSGKVPTPFGDITVSWDNSEHKLDVSVPQNADVTVILPDESAVRMSREKEEFYV